MSIIVAPSILSADFGNLQKEVEWINQSEADWFHVDIMDGVFVPNISFGFPIIKVLQKYAKKPLDVHLMIVNPDAYLVEFSNAGASMISVHYEACTHLHRTVQTIKSLNCGAGIALNPHTPVSLLEDILPEIDMVCLMSVNPGFGGQRFIDNTYKKIELLRKMAQQKNPMLKIEIDGGVSNSNAQKLLDAGADVLVAGNYVFADSDPSNAIRNLKKLNKFTSI